MTNHDLNLATHIFQNVIPGKTFYYVVYLSVDHLDCSIRFKLPDFDNKVLFIYIEDKIYDRNDSYYQYNIRFESVEELELKLKTFRTETLPSLTFNKLLSKFETYNELNFHNAFELYLKDFQENEPECSVCYEKTNNCSYNCKHHICMICANKIKKQKCPLCRAPFHFEFEEEGNEED